MNPALPFLRLPTHTSRKTATCISTQQYMQGVANQIQVAYDLLEKRDMEALKPHLSKLLDHLVNEVKPNLPGPYSVLTLEKMQLTCDYVGNLLVTAFIKQDLGLLHDAREVCQKLMHSTLSNMMH